MHKLTPRQRAALRRTSMHDALAHLNERLALQAATIAARNARIAELAAEVRDLHSNMTHLQIENACIRRERAGFCEVLSAIRKLAEICEELRLGAHADDGFYHIRHLAAAALDGTLPGSSHKGHEPVGVMVSPPGVEATPA